MNIIFKFVNYYIVHLRNIKQYYNELYLNLKKF